jgi:hypothetical protein
VSPVEARPRRFPRWSPDHTKVAYLRDGDVVVIDATGGDERVLARGIGLGFRAPPTWSPDGTRVAFTRQLPDCTPDNPNWYREKCISAVFAVHVATGDETRLTEAGLHGIEFAAEPEWLADGSLIHREWCTGDEGCYDVTPFFVGSVFQRYAFLFVQRGMQLPIGNALAFGGRAPAFTKDLSRFLFAGAAGMDNPDGGVNRGAAGVIGMCRLATKSCPMIVRAVSAWSARWSPDESRFAYMTTFGISTQASDASAPAPAPKPAQEPPREPAFTFWRPPPPTPAPMATAVARRPPGAGDSRGVKPSGEAAESPNVLSLAVGHGLDW